jgi:hypothetical protein
MKWIRSLVPVAVIGLIGCDGSDVKVVKVTGTITKNAKPVADAAVAFFPDPSNKSQTPGAATTGADGNYAVAWQNHAGVAPGKYRVVVTPAPTGTGGAKVPEAFKNDPVMARMATGEGVDPAKDPAASQQEFEANVTETDREFNFQLKPPAAKKGDRGR